MRLLLRGFGLYVPAGQSFTLVQVSLAGSRNGTGEAAELPYSFPCPQNEER